MLPREAYARILSEGQILGLKMLVGSEKRIFHFRADTVEGPNDLMNYSLGAAVQTNTAGTDWDEIIDSSGRYYLEPEYEKIIYHFFFGISPAQTWIYRRYPSNKDINSLLGTRTIGSGVGHIDGIKSPYRSPSPISEMFTIKGLHPSFLGYAPYAEPASITVRLNFFVTRYDVTFLGVDPSGTDEDQKRLIAPQEARDRAKVRTTGGHELVPIPSWIESSMRR